MTSRENRVGPALLRGRKVCLGQIYKCSLTLVGSGFHPSYPEGSRAMAAVTCLYGLLGFAWFASANIFGEFLFETIELLD